MKETWKEECLLFTCLNQYSSVKRSITRAWFWGGMRRRNKLLGEDMQQLWEVSCCKMQGVKVERSRGKGGRRRKERETDGNVGLCFA